MRNKRVKKHIRLLSLLLCAVMVLGIIPVTNASAAEETLTVSQSSVQLPKNSSVTVTAACSAENVTPAYQWQIRVPGAGIWVDISGETGAAIRVNYGMVASLLSGGAATIRAKATIGSGTVYTGEVTVNITDPVAAAAPAPSSSARTFALPRKAAAQTASADTDALAKKAEDAKAAAATALEALNQAKSELDAVNQAVSAAQQAVTTAQQAVDAAKQAIAAAAAPQETTAAPTDSTSTDSTSTDSTSEPTTAPAKSDEELQAELAQANEALTAAQTALAEAQAKVAPAQEKVNEAQKAYDAAKAASDQAASTYSAATASTNEAESTTTTYNVVINYLFQNNEIVADPYTATLAAGEKFSATVTFPTIQGYLPYVDENQQDSIDLNYTAIDRDYTYNVVYKPTNVDYTVIHYKQNLNDDNYTEAERETKQGLTNSTVPDVAKTYEGFYSLLYEKPAIAADGSTLVEVYYDRYYYLMNFDLDGGYGVEPIYARYGSPIGNVGTPTKAGYAFGGWSLDGTVQGLPDTMPAENRTYKAIWTADDTAKVTVVFWGENADDEEYSYIRSMTVEAKPGESYTFDGSSLTCPLLEHSHGSCTLICGHTHTTDCYKTNNEFATTTKPSGDLTDTGNGIYTYTGWLYTYYYLNIGGNWYCGTDRWGNADATQRITYSCSHTHTDACYSCGMIEHTHGSGCSNLWKFVKSDTVTVAADGSSVVNVYYDRTTFTLTFHYNYRSNRGGYQSSDTVTAKWGADIGQKFLAINSKAKGNLWSRYESGDSPWTSYLQIMPKESRDYYCKYTSSTEQSAEYYTETLTPGQYKLEYTVTAYYGRNLTISEEDFYPMDGFTYDHGTDGNNNSMPKPGSYSDFNGAKFYYTRNSYNLTFNDGYNVVKTESVKYEAPLSTYRSYVPAVPSAYEPGSVTFGGWYLNPECTGAEYKLDEHTMPADNVLLYAKWVPVTHTVEFYLDKAALDAGTKLEGYNDITVPHGSKATPTPANPTNGSYTFVGWFYNDGSVEKAFDFANMPVNKDLQVYGKWSSNVLKEYTIYYKYKDEAGNEIKIAAPTTGSGLAGITKTFDAKGGAELDAGYQEGYFPVAKSHSMTLDINATEENDTNVYTFWYVQKDAVPYTVKYLNKVTGQPVATEKTVKDNRKAVVTETFVPVKGMMPDAYQKRLVVSAEDGAVNEIIFYYTEDTTHAYYKITHYTENLAKDAQGNTTWTEYASSQAVGDIGTTYDADPMTIPGFTYNSNVQGTLTSGKLTADGLELKLYYTRNSYPYQVRYLEQGTGKQLAEPKNSTGKYGQVISESAIDIDNYEAVTPTPQTLNIRIEESKEAKLNIITFYYKLGLADLTITKTGCEDIDENQSFIFDVTGPNGYSQRVVIKENGSVTIKDLPIDTYTITEVSNWSWRYSANGQTVTLQPGVTNKVTVQNNRNLIYWLNGCGYAQNIFG